MTGAFGARTRKKGLGINITPLLDIVFLLLIFFMVSSTFRDNVGIDVVLPSAATSEQQQQAQYAVVVTATGEVLFDGKEIAIAQLRDKLLHLQREEPEAKVVLEADKKAAFQDVVAVIDTARSVGGKQLIIQTAPPTTP